MLGHFTLLSVQLRQGIHNFLNRREILGAATAAGLDRKRNYGNDSAEASRAVSYHSCLGCFLLLAQCVQ
jgi:hypothetical protein